MSVRRRAVAPFFVLIAVLACAASPAHALDAPTLKRLLTRNEARLGPLAGAHVVDLTDNVTLFSRRADLALSPASNEKLFTTATALLRFGPDATFSTSVRLGPLTTIDDAGAVHGDIYLVGGGDPSLDDAALRALVRQLVGEHGITRLDGRVLGDESLFDQLRGSVRTFGRPDGDIGGWLGALTWGHGRAGTDGPAQMAALRLQELLQASKVKVARKARAGSLGGTTGGTPSAPLATVASPPLRRLVQITNQPSDNFYAETLLKDLGVHFGAGGTTTAGAAVVRHELAQLGIAPTIRDGSGLSRSDHATARQLVALLAAMRRRPFAADFVASLARPGLAGTTLAKRMRGTAAFGRCQAKTGTIRAVSALSGYCTARGGSEIAFSFLENRVCTLCAKRIEDRMVAAIARYDG